MQPNRYGAACATCSTYVPPQAGGCRKVSGQWLVFCTEHTATGDAPAAVAAAVADEDQPPVEVRVSGTPAQCQAVREALTVGMGLRVAGHSGPHLRRDDDRVTVYLRVEVASAVLAQVQRDLQP